jgi:hypothetical protein
MAQEGNNNSHAQRPSILGSKILVCEKCRAFYDRDNKTGNRAKFRYEMAYTYNSLLQVSEM